MTFECRCPGCGARFRAPDTAAGRQVKCPQCAVMIQLARQAPAGPTLSPPPPPVAPKAAVGGPVAQPQPPAATQPIVPPRPAAAGQPGWFVRTANDKQHGPMAKEQLDRLVTQQQVDAFCEVRRADWDQWRLIEEVYPSLAIADAEDDLMARGAGSHRSAGPTIERSSRLWPCPDCGADVSRRAVECPHCGCPLVKKVPARPPVQAPPLPPAGQAAPSAQRDHVPRGVGRIVFVSIAVVSVIAVVAAGVYLAVHFLGRSTSTAPSPPVAVPIAQPSPAPPAGLSDAQIAQCKEKVAAAMARQVDERLRATHDAMAQLGEIARTLKSLPELAEPNPKRSGAKSSAQPGPSPGGPYQSRFEQLHRDCRAYLDAHIARPVPDEKTIWSAGEDWSRMQMPEERLLESLLQSSGSPPSAPPREQERGAR